MSGEGTSVGSSDGSSGIDVAEARYVHANLDIPRLGTDLAEVDRLIAKSLSPGTALHAGSWPQVARKAPAIARGCWVVGTIGSMPDIEGLRFAMRSLR